MKLVTLQQAKKLKELGCKLLTHAYYSFDEKLRFHTGIYDWNTYATENTYAVPTIPEALDWFREEKGIECWVQFNYINGKGYFGVFFKKDDVINRQVASFKDTSSLAESALLDALIEYVSK